jgi:hypothetical protein
MTTRDDALDLQNVPDRVFYELGVMLDKDDFTAEQTYHRGRLARALAFLHGAGTVAGLRVEIPDPVLGGDPQPDAEEVRVHPGIAVDEVGRLLDVPTLRCTRLGKWLAAQTADTRTDEGLTRAARLAKAFHEDSPGSGAGSLIVDVFLRFAACDRGKTPAFAAGPFDALDAVQPSRVRDGFELQLVPREETTPPSPTDLWPALTGSVDERRTQLNAAVFAAWEKLRPKDRREDPAIDVDPVVPLWFDPYGAHHWLLLARLAIPWSIQIGADGVQVARRDATRKVVVDNELRAFVYTPGAVVRLLSP